MTKSFVLSTPYSLILSRSLQAWLDYSFYNSGALKVVNNQVFVKQKYPNVSNNRVWGGLYKNWHHKAAVTPVFPSGANNSYTINYKEGLIIFNEDKASCSCSYTYKPISVIDSRDNEYFRGEAFKLVAYEGTFKEHSIQLPCIAIEIANIFSRPEQIGSYSRDVNARVSLYTFAESLEQSDRITNVLHNQIDSNFKLFNYELANGNADLPFNPNGTAQNLLSDYITLTEDYPYSKSVNSIAHIYDAEIESMQKLPNGMYYNTVNYDIRSVLTMGL